MISKYPHLAQMGVQNPQEITGYTLYHVAPATDVLKIKYQRPKGSLLPITRSYSIGRSPHVRVIDSGSGKTEEFYEISPILSQAVAELDSIVDNKASADELKQQILAEIERMQVEFTTEINALRQLVNKIK